MGKRTTAYIGLGGNVGDVFNNMRTALDYLNDHPKLIVSQISKLYKTPPWGIEDQDWFLNACAAVETDLPAPELLEFCLDIEKRLHRVREIRWGPRTIDLDVLAYGNLRFETETLTLPHPRIAERAFVLVPLGDIAPGFKINGQTCAQMMLNLTDVDIEVEIDHQNWWGN